MDEKRDLKLLSDLIKAVNILPDNKKEYLRGYAEGVVAARETKDEKNKSEKAG